tara:strand:- start:713 stop:1435 length:723 start_codon:yes stop_codon:yes gene_type:complete
MSKIKIVLHTQNAEEYIKLFKHIYKDIEVKYYDKEKLPAIDKWQPDIVLLNNDEGVISPEYRSIENNKFLDSLPSNIENDITDSELINKYRSNDILLIGVGRGAHLLCIASNGNLISKVNNYKDVKTKIIGLTDINSKSLFNSDAYSFDGVSKVDQLMHPFDSSYCYYNILAYSDKYMSNVYLNKLGKDMDMPKNYVEPQVIYFPDLNALAFQSHFEDQNNNSFQTYFEHIILQYITNKK